MRIAARLIFAKVGAAIVIVIARGCGRGEVAEVLEFPLIGHAVLIGISDEHRLRGQEIRTQIDPANVGAVSEAFKRTRG